MPTPLFQERAALNDLVQTELPKVREGLASQRTANSAVVEALAPMVLAQMPDLAAVTRTLSDPNIGAAEVDALMQRIKEHGGATELMGGIGLGKAMFEGASNEELRDFANMIASKGGPGAKAAALELLTHELDVSSRDSREEVLRDGMLKILQSGGGNVLEADGGASAVSGAVAEMLRGDRPPTPGQLMEATKGLPPDRLAQMDSAIMKGFDRYVYEQTKGSIGVDILKCVEINGQVSASTPQKKIAGVDEDGKPIEMENPVQASGRIELKNLNPGKLLEAESVRKAETAVRAFDEYMAQNAKRLSEESKRYGHVYEQTLGGWKSAGQILGGHGKLAVPKN
jgi:hypothetical protein